MAQAGQLVRVTSTNGVHFTDAVAQNAAEMEHFQLPGTDRGRAVGILRTIVLWSSANRQWELNFYSTLNGRNPDPNEDGFLSAWRFSAASGYQIGGTGLYRYSVSGLYELLRDDEDTSSLHIELTPRDGAKSSYGAGEHVRLAVTLETTLGW